MKHHDDSNEDDGRHEIDDQYSITIDNVDVQYPLRST